MTQQHHHPQDDPPEEQADTPTTPTQPAPPHTNRTGIGSLAGQLTLHDDWDTPETNDQIANDFHND